MRLNGINESIRVTRNREKLVVRRELTASFRVYPIIKFGRTLFGIIENLKNMNSSLLECQIMKKYER